MCDDIDNDCSGQVDEDFPTKLGKPPAAYAATLIDSASPHTARVDDKLSVWAVFRNDGTQVWKAQEIWLTAVSSEDGKASYYDPETWASFETVQVLSHDVEPKGTVLFKWDISIPKNERTIKQTFRLQNPKGSWFMCPTPQVSFNVTVQSIERPDAAVNDASNDAANDTDSPVNQTIETSSDSGCTCQTNPSPNKRVSAWWLVAGLLTACGTRRRRAS